VTAGAKRSAAQKVRAITRLISVPILFARVRLTMSADPAVERPATAQATLDLNGRLLRAHVAAPTMRKAIDELNDRLRDQLERYAPDWESMRGTTAAADSIRRGRADLAPPRPVVSTHQPSRRTVVRHEAHALPRLTLDDAIVDMDMLGDDFYLFTDLATGQDSVLSRDATATRRLAQLHPHPGAPPRSASQLSCSEAPAPRLSVEEAAEQLDLTGSQFLFFENAETGRGNVVFQRDGDYGLIAPPG
jgi:ribosome-associated translation inhibitor RaiA